MMDDSNYTESNQSIQQELQNTPAAGSLMATDAGATPVKHKRRGWAKQNCYYLTHALLFFGADLVNIVSLILFMTDASTYNSTDGGKLNLCSKSFLFSADGTCNGSELSCHVVVGAESIASLTTLAMFVMYMVWAVKGAKM